MSNFIHHNSSFDLKTFLRQIVLNSVKDESQAKVFFQTQHGGRLQSAGGGRGTDFVLDLL